MHQDVVKALGHTLGEVELGMVSLKTEKGEKWPLEDELGCNNSSTSFLQIEEQEPIVSNVETKARTSTKLLCEPSHIMLSKDKYF